MNKSKEELIQSFIQTRKYTESICHELEVEDYVIQADSFVSPAKWHLAHTTWFFEEFILKRDKQYKSFDDNFCFLFNSYYNSVGKFWPQDKRGLLSRPTVNQIYKYRKNIDKRIENFFENDSSNEVLKLLEIGIHHEQQHQELLFMDIKYNMYLNPLKPIFHEVLKEERVPVTNSKLIEVRQTESIIGCNYGQEFCFDNETPEHLVKTDSFEISHDFISNGEYLEFIESKAIDNHEYWLSDGYRQYQDGKFRNPLYWYKENNKWYEYHLDRKEKLDLDMAVKHISFYEANAFCNWKGLRLPTEYEWRAASNTLDNIGDEKKLWQWTQSPYQSYPGYKRPAGALGEYNQKFMLNQIVLKGGCYFTPKSHYRITYRNFFYPEQKWMLSGFRTVKEES